MDPWIQILQIAIRIEFSWISNTAEKQLAPFNFSLKYSTCWRLIPWTNFDCQTSFNSSKWSNIATPSLVPQAARFVYSGPHYELLRARPLYQVCYTYCVDSIRVKIIKSIRCMIVFGFCTVEIVFNLPTQGSVKAAPFWNPLSHIHLYDPSMFMQVPCIPQMSRSPIPSPHSLMSTQNSRFIIWTTKLRRGIKSKSLSQFRRPKEAKLSRSQHWLLSGGKSDLFGHKGNAISLGYDLEHSRIFRNQSQPKDLISRQVQSQLRCR